MSEDKDQGTQISGQGSAGEANKDSAAGSQKGSPDAQTELPAATIPNGAPSPLAVPPLAYENPAFLNGPDGRLIRIVAEYMEPLARLRRERIQDTVVFFGSARFRGREEADHALELLDNTGSLHPAPSDEQPPACRISPRAGLRTCSASAPLRQWPWPAITRTHGAWRRCLRGGPRRFRRAGIVLWLRQEAARASWRPQTAALTRQAAKRSA